MVFYFCRQFDSIFTPVSSTIGRKSKRSSNSKKANENAVDCEALKESLFCSSSVRNSNSNERVKDVDVGEVPSQEVRASEMRNESPKVEARGFGLDAG